MKNRFIVPSILNSQTLADTLQALNAYHDEVFLEFEKKRKAGKSFLGGADEFNNVIEENNGQDFANMTEDETSTFIKKIYMAWIFLYGQSDKLDRQKADLQKNRKDIAEIEKVLEDVEGKMQVYDGIIAMTIKSRNQEDKVVSIYNDLEKNHFLYREFFCKQPEADISLEHSPSILEGKHFAEFEAFQQYTHAQAQLDLALDAVRNKSKLMRYVYGDKDGMVTTRDGKTTIASLYKRLAEIDNSKIAASQKLIQMEQAVLDIYTQVRNDQGWRDSQLANALENFIKDKQGLNLQEKYNIKVPHKSEKKSINLAELNSKDKYEKLYARLFDEKFKTKKIELRNKLINKIGLIRDNKDMTEYEKLTEIQRTIADSWEKAQNMADSRWFFHQSNYADALKNFMQSQFGKDVKDMRELVKYKRDPLMEMKDFSIRKK